MGAAIPLAAHHSFAAEYDGSKAVRLKGTLTKIDWTNPHSYFYLDVKDDNGNVVNWGCEGGGPGALSRRGFKRGDIKLGDTIHLYSPLRPPQLIFGMPITAARERCRISGKTVVPVVGANSHRPTVARLL